MDNSIIIKTPEQINKIKKSCKLASKCLDFIEPYIEPGITTEKLDSILEYFIRDHGAVPAPQGYCVNEKKYPKATCISLNEVVCHGIPNETILKEGDILNIDVTTILNGYYGDTSRMYCVGEVSDNAKKLIKVTKECLELGISCIKPGSQFGNIGHAISHHAHNFGYSVVTDFCGHGTGVEFHEQPNIPHIANKGTGPTIQRNMIFTIEPMINEGSKDVVISENDGWTATTADNSLSAQWEHTILVTDFGYEILTSS